MLTASMVDSAWDAMESEPVENEPVIPLAWVVQPDPDLRTRAQRACDKLPSCDRAPCNSTWCDVGGCEVPCEALELLSSLDSCDAGCL